MNGSEVKLFVADNMGKINSNKKRGEEEGG